MPTAAQVAPRRQ